MKKVLLLDTSIGTSNIGDEIIMECVRKELSVILKNNFVYNVPTHLPVFNAISVYKNSYSVQNYALCDYKFAGGSNLIVKDLRTHYPQWNINKWNSKPLYGTITMGVGVGSSNHIDSYTTGIYKRVLSNKYFNSVRDERSKQYFENVLGLKAINTGCVTMWKLTPEFCQQIPQKKADKAIITITGTRDGINAYEQSLINIVQKNYSKVYFWPQGDLDYECFYRYKNISNIVVLPPNKHVYEQLLNNIDVDYIGTRLHGGVYAMRHKKRSIIIAIDERAMEINAVNNLNCLTKDKIDNLDDMINSDFKTKIVMPYDEIARWKSQFDEFKV